MESDKVSDWLITLEIFWWISYFYFFDCYYRYLTSINQNRLFLNIYLNNSINNFFFEGCWLPCRSCRLFPSYHSTYHATPYEVESTWRFMINVARRKVIVHSWVAIPCWSSTCSRAALDNQIVLKTMCCMNWLRCNIN